MFTRAEKGYLALTLALLAAGSGIKAWRLAHVKIGPFADPFFSAVQVRGDAMDAVASTKVDSIPGNTATTGANDSILSTANGSDSLTAVPNVSKSPLAVNDSSSELPSSLSSASFSSPKDPSSRSWGDRSTGSRPTKSGFTGKVDLNKAPVAELTRVKGIGEKTASAIVEYRTAHGPFKDLRDLLQVKGIGQKKLEKLGPYLIL